jgi:hypothetical protein
MTSIISSDGPEAAANSVGTANMAIMAMTQAAWRRMRDMDPLYVEPAGLADGLARNRPRVGRLVAAD